MQRASVRIGYWIFNYAPQWEAASSELETLLTRFESQFVTQLISQNFNTKKISLFGQRKYLPLPFSLVALPFFSRFASSFQINHIFSSLGEPVLLSRLSHLNTVLTVSKDTDSLNAFEKNIVHLKRLKYIVVESEWHQEMLEQAGIKKEAIKLIYPGTRIKPYQVAQYPFKILLATSPLGKYGLVSRGIYLLLQAASLLPEVRFILVWREHGYRELCALIDEYQLSNVEVINGYVPNMDEIYQSVHATILPGLTYSSIKPCPQSALNSLAHGKPVLVSQPSSISHLVERNNCGVVFEPSVNCLVWSITHLMENYPLFQENCHRTIEELFSETVFIERYQEIYESML